MAFSPELSAAPASERYDVLSVLGRGASSIVYRAYDREMGFFVALKSLRFHEHEDVYAIKREFRYFRDISHPNLVQLYDLIVDEDSCFLTMELIEGHEFTAEFAALPMMQDAQALQAGIRHLRAALREFAIGLRTLHDHKRLHRDIKPNNVMVENGQRTVLLDFGLSTDLAPKDSLLTQSRLYAGTPGYIAPERLAGTEGTPESDIYALGVVLYQTLAGRLPYAELPPVALFEAHKTPPPRPRDFSTWVPEDLDDLAMRLIARTPEERPSLGEVIELTGGKATVTELDSRRRFLDIDEAFVGRERELALLDEALRESRDGHPVLATVTGVSGVGKSTLLERFLSWARSEHQALVLRSRCHHQETVRHKAVDGVVDALSRYLMTLGDDRLREISPRWLPSLITVFPVLGRVSFPFDLVDDDEVLTDPGEIVRTAAVALRTLLANLAENRPLVISIDDLQWSDRAGIPFLKSVLASPESRGLMTVVSQRSEDLEDRPDLDFGAAMEDGASVRTLTIELGNFGVDEVRHLFDRLGLGDTGLTDRIVRETDGLPFFVSEIGILLAGTGKEGSAFPTDVVAHRIDALSARQRAVLELIAVAGSPLPEALLLGLIRHDDASGHEVYQLLSRSLIRRGTVHGEQSVETYHDRIRQGILKGLEGEPRQERHRQLADAMAKREKPDLRFLVEHYISAGMDDRAAVHALQAARRSAERLSFDSAAEYYEVALRLGCVDGSRAAVEAERAEVLADAGRCAEAAEGYLEAASLIGTARAEDPFEIARIKALAAKQYLYSGQLPKGLSVYRELFAELRIPFPETLRDAQKTALLNRLVAQMPVLNRYLLRKRSKTETELEAHMLREASMGLLMLDFVLGDAMFSWYLRYAHLLKQKSMMVRACATEATVLANLGQPWAIKRSRKLLQRADEFRRDSDEAYDTVQYHTGRAGTAWSLGDWKTAAAAALDGIEYNSQEIGRFDFHISILLGYRISALILMGDYDTATGERDRVLEDAARRGDAYVTRFFRASYNTHLDAAADDVASAIEASDLVLEGAADDRFTSQHWAHFNCKANALIYLDDAVGGWDLLSKQWHLVERTGFLKLACIGSQLRDMRARILLRGLNAESGASGLPPKNELLKMLEEDAGRIDKAKAVACSGAWAAGIRAGLARARDDNAGLETNLRRAAEIFDSAGMPVHSLAAERRLGELIGPELIDRADAGLRAHGVRNPDRMARFLVPG